MSKEFYILSEIADKDLEDILITQWINLDLIRQKNTFWKLRKFFKA